MRPIRCPKASAGVAAARIATIGQRLRAMCARPTPTPPIKPPYQLKPPRESSSSRIGVSGACSTVHRSFAPTRPPITPRRPASVAWSGSPDRRSSRRNNHSPTSAARATITPKLVTSKLPIRNSTGYMDYRRVMDHERAESDSLPTPVHVRQDCPHLLDLLLLPGDDGFAEFENPLILKRRLVAH
jgi:hypothetical protein